MLIKTYILIPLTSDTLNWTFFFFTKIPYSFRLDVCETCWYFEISLFEYVVAELVVGPLYGA